MLDTQDLDVFAMEPVTCRWVRAQLTIAQDLFSTRAAVARVHDAITRLRREKTPVSVAAVARRADVSRTF